MAGESHRETEDAMKIGSCKPWIPDGERLASEESLARKSEDYALCTRQFIEAILAIRAKGIGDAEVLWNASCHVNLISHDLTVLVHCMATTKDIWARRAIGRTLATIMYEGCDDLLELYGKPFIEVCESLGIIAAFDTEWRSTRKKLSEFWNTHRESLKVLRVKAGAHRDHDALLLLKTIAECSPDVILEQATDMDKILCEFGALTMRIIEAANEVYRAKGVIT